jgi:hypothetical protein
MVTQRSSTMKRSPTLGAALAEQVKARPESSKDHGGRIGNSCAGADRRLGIFGPIDPGLSEIQPGHPQV